MLNILTEVKTLDETLTIPSQLISAQQLPTLILGGGFTGLFTALHLSHQHYKIPTILIDRSSRFIFKPLLYEFLSGEMKTKYICPRYDTLLHKSGIEFIQDTIQFIDLQQREVQLASGLHYNYGNLVLSLGSVAAYFDVEGAEEYTLPFRTTEDAVALSRQLRNCLKRATQTPKPQQQALLTVAIVGAGCTGIELAATLADLLPNWYAALGSFEKQRIGIEQQLQDRWETQVQVFKGFYFCEPFVQKVVTDIIDRGFKNLLIFPLLVVDSAFTGKIAVEQVNEVITANESENLPFKAIRYIPAFATEPTYIDLLVRQIKESLNQLSTCGCFESQIGIVLTVHGGPEQANGLLG